MESQIGSPKVTSLGDGVREKNGIKEGIEIKEGLECAQHCTKRQCGVRC